MVETVDDLGAEHLFNLMKVTKVRLLRPVQTSIIDMRMLGNRFILGGWAF